MLHAYKDMLSRIHNRNATDAEVLTAVTAADANDDEIADGYATEAKRISCNSRRIAVSARN